MKIDNLNIRYGGGSLCLEMRPETLGSGKTTGIQGQRFGDPGQRFSGWIGDGNYAEARGCQRSRASAAQDSVRNVGMWFIRQIFLILTYGYWFHQFRRYLNPPLFSHSIAVSPLSTDSEI